MPVPSKRVRSWSAVCAPVVALTLVTVGPVSAHAALAAQSESPNDVIDIPDPVLNAAVHDVLQIPAGQPTTRAQMVTIIGLITPPGVTDLTGLETATQINHFTSPHGSISDLAELGHRAIEDISLPNQRLTDVRALTGPHRSTLDLSENQIGDVSYLGAYPDGLYSGQTNLDFGVMHVPRGATIFRAPVDLSARVPGRNTVTVTSGPTMAGTAATWSDVTESDTTLPVEFTSTFGRKSGPFGGSGTYRLVWVDYANAAPPEGTVGSAYDMPFTVDDGFAPTSWTLPAESVPGLTLRSDGHLAGTPTTIGTYPITVRSTDANGNDLDKAYTITVAGIASSFTSQDAVSGTAGQPFTAFPITTTGNPTPAPTTPVTPEPATTPGTDRLPKGLMLNTTTAPGLTGTIDAGVAPGAYSFDLRAANGVGKDATQTLTITVKAGPGPAPKPSGDRSHSGRLAYSGFDGSNLAWFAGGLLAAGAALTARFVVRRRSSANAPDVPEADGR